MADDDKLLKARLDASRAKALIEDEVLSGAFEALKRSYSDKLLSTSFEQVTARETLYQAHRLVGEIQRHLHWVIGNGKMAEAELNHLIQLNEVKKKRASA